MQKDWLDEIPNDSWVLRYYRCFPQAESPDSYIITSALAIFGGAIGRRCFIDLDVHRVYGLLNLLLIGPSGIGKSTALRDMAADFLLPTLPEDISPGLITGKATKEAVHEELMVKPHAIVLASEFANLFSKEKYNEGQIAYFTDLLDLAPTSVRTKSGGKLTVECPEVSVCGGSTKEWLQDQLPSTATAGGFLPRFFIVKEDTKRQRVPNPTRAMSRAARADLDRLRDRTFGEFPHLVTRYSGPVEFEDYSAEDIYAIWYQSHTPEIGVLSPFSARAGAHILRLSMLFALSCERTSIRRRDIRAAIALYGYSMRRLQEVIVPMSAQGRLIARVLEVIGDDVMSNVQIRRAMRNYCGSQDTDKLIQGLVSSGDLVPWEQGSFKRANV